METQDAWDYHFWNGIKYKFPLCCIIWFTDSQTNKGTLEGSLYQKIFREAWMNGKVKIPSIEANYGRAMCPMCLLNAFIKNGSSFT